MNRRATILGLAVGLPVSAFFLWLAVRRADLDLVWATLRNANPGPVVLALAAMCGVYLIQAERWRRIARVPLGLRRFFELVLCGIGCNNVLPGRVGDLLSARWLGLDARIPGGRALATVVLDRGSDLVGLVVVLLLTLPFVTPAAWLGRIVVGSVIGTAALALGLLAARRYSRTRARDRHAERGVLRRVARDVVDGLAEPLGRRRLAVVLALSVAAWGTWAVGALFVGRALGIELTPLEALFVAAVINLGVAIPSSPGFVGTYQWLAIAALGLFAVPQEQAFAFAILLQAVWYVPTTIAAAVLLGGRAMKRAGRRRRSKRATVRDDVGPEVAL
jgi:uncharacterized protein (TIRG00374 family)